MFLDNDVNIDRDVLDSLEAKAIDYVREHGSYETDNGNTPAPRMNPYKEQRVEDLHGSILFRMRVLGYDLDRKETTPVAVNTVFHTKKNGVRRLDDTTGIPAVSRFFRAPKWTLVMR